jgi:hypothetical protein
VPSYDPLVMARPGWLASRLILVVAVIGCMLGLGHLRCGSTDPVPAAMSASSTSATPADHAPNSDLHGSLAERHGGHEGDHVDGCCADSTDLSAVTAPLVPQAHGNAAATTPATSSGNTAPAAAHLRPPDITALCVHRT